MKVRCLGLACAVFLPLIDAAPPADFDSLFRPLIGAQTPGLAVMVRRDGQTVFQQGYGVTDIRSLRKIDRATNFRLASFSKQFTAMTIMLLVHDGKLRYDQTLTDIFPDFPPYGRMITIHHLLTHTSGLPDYEDLMGGDWSASHQIGDGEVLQLLKHQHSGKFAPGTKWDYCNSGYVLLGVVAAKLAGRSFPQVLQQRIFQPLHMSSTLAYVKGQPEISHRAYGYSRDEHGELIPNDQSSTSATLGDGGIYSNLIDLAKWDDALRNNVLISSHEMSAALTTVLLANGGKTFWPAQPGGDNLSPDNPVTYGFGWFLDPYKGHTRSWHSGTTCGFRTIIDRFPNDHLSIVILSNRTDIDPTSLALQVADMILTK